MGGLYRSEKVIYNIKEKWRHTCKRAGYLTQLFVVRLIVKTILKWVEILMKTRPVNFYRI